MRLTVSVTGALLAAVLMRAALQSPAVRTLDQAILGEHAGVYQWGPNAFVYLQMWKEFSGFAKPGQLTAFDESGEVRTLYPLDRDHFFAGPGAAVADSIESRIDFERDRTGTITALTWQRGAAGARIARRVEIEKREDVRFSNGDIQLAGTLISPLGAGKRPAIILVHGSGAEDREFILPFAHFLVRHGVAVFGYDKRGVGGSTGDWNAASFDDLAGDVVAAFAYLKTRSDIDGTQIGMLGVSQAGWIMPLAALRAPDLAFLISVSGAAVPPAQTTIDEARNEMTANRMRPEIIDQVIGLMNLQYEVARTGQGWDNYIAARNRIAAQLGGTPPETFPGTPDHPSWLMMRRLYFYDPAPTLRQLRLPILALFGELDNNILPDKNRAAWDAALKTSGNRDYVLTITPKANHYQWLAKVGNNAEEPSLQGYAPAYFTIIQDWLATRIRGFRGSR